MEKMNALEAMLCEHEQYSMSFLQNQEADRQLKVIAERAAIQAASAAGAAAAKKNDFISIMAAQRNFLMCQQGIDQSTAAYLAHLHGWAVTITQHGGSIAANPKLIPAVDSGGHELSDEERLL
jgi:hypothetical protein